MGGNGRMKLGKQVKEKDKKKWQELINKWNKRNDKIRNTTERLETTKEGSKIDKRS